MTKIINFYQYIISLVNKVTCESCNKLILRKDREDSWLDYESMWICEDCFIENCESCHMEPPAYDVDGQCTQCMVGAAEHAYDSLTDR